MKSRKRKDGYSSEEIEYLKEIGDQTGRSNKEITKIFNEKFNQDKTEVAIIGIKSRFGIKSYTRVYTDEEINFVRKNIHGKTNKDITEIFNKKFNQSRTEGSIKSMRLENGILLDENGRFEKGHRPHNSLEVGDTIVDLEGYTLIKTEEPNTWEYLHRVVWEKENGKVPDGFAVLFGDKDKTNIQLDNLILVSRAQLVRLNYNRLLQDDVELTKTAINIVDLEMKIADAKNKDRN